MVKLAGHSVLKSPRKNSFIVLVPKGSCGLELHVRRHFIPRRDERRNFEVAILTKV